MLIEMHLGSHKFFTDYNYNQNMYTNLEKLQNITFHKILFGGFRAITSR